MSKRYGTVMAVDDVSLEVQPGEVYALLGPWFSATSYAYPDGRPRLL